MRLPRRFRHPRLASLLALLFSASAHAQTPFFAPTVTSVGTATTGGEAYAGSTATDAQGNVYVTGTFGGRLSFGALTLSSRLSNLDVFVAKYDVAGNCQWAVSAGGDLPDYGMGLALDATGNVYLTGMYASPAQFGPQIALPAPVGRADVFVAKLDPAGNWLWATNGGGAEDDNGAALAVNAAGTLTLAGNVGVGPTNFGPVPLANSAARAGFVAHLDANGNWLAAAAIEGAAIEDVALDAVGNAYVCGSFAGASVRVGSSTLVNAAASTSDSFVAKLTPAGSWQWATRGGGGGPDRAQAVAVTGNGEVYITGGFSGSAVFGPAVLASQGPAFDIYAASLDATGAWRWATQAGGTDAEAGSDLALDSSGQPVITGEFFSPSIQFGATAFALSGTQGRSDAFVAKLDAAGAWQWALGSSGAGEETGHALALDADGGMYLLGTYLGVGQFGAATLPGASFFSRVFLAKVYDQGALAVVATLAPSSGTPGQAVTLTGSGLAGTTAVWFNGRPAASFAVQSATQLTAVVPAGVMAGPVSVRTAAGTSNSSTSFVPTVLSVGQLPRTSQMALHPNPANSDVFASGLAPGRAVQLVDALGRVVRETTVSGTGAVSVLGMAPGHYLLRTTVAQGRQVAGRVLVE